MNQSNGDFQYDVCLSFAGENRAYVAAVADALKHRGIRVFYDDYELVTLWGKDLYVHLDWVYQRAARYCVLFASKDYARKVWTNHERVSAQARAIQEKGEYILPARFDDTEIPGLRNTVMYIDLQDITPEELAALIDKKLGPRMKRNFLPPEPDRLFDALELVEEDEREEAVRRAGAFLTTLQRMTEEERSLVFKLFLEGCPSELPENIHISVDLLRRVTGVAPSEAITMLQGISSLGFEHEVRFDDEHDETLVVQWHDFTVYEEALLDEATTLLATKMLNIVPSNHCAKCAEQELEKLDFSALATRTAQADEHSPMER
jgi:TIR domain